MTSLLQSKEDEKLPQEQEEEEKEIEILNFKEEEKASDESIYDSLLRLTDANLKVLKEINKQLLKNRRDERYERLKNSVLYH